MMAGGCSLDDLPDVEHAFILRTLGPFVKYECVPGYRFPVNGSATIAICEPDGRWNTDPIGECIVDENYVPPVSTTQDTIQHTTGVASTIVHTTAAHVTAATSDGPHPAGQSNSDDNNTTLTIIIISASLLAFILILISIAMLLYSRRKKRLNKKLQQSIANLLKDDTASNNSTTSYTTMKTVNDAGGSHGPARPLKFVGVEGRARYPSPNSLVDGEASRHVNVIQITESNDDLAEDAKDDSGYMRASDHIPAPGDGGGAPSEPGYDPTDKLGSDITVRTSGFVSDQDSDLCVYDVDSNDRRDESKMPTVKEVPESGSDVVSVPGRNHYVRDPTARNKDNLPPVMRARRNSEDSLDSGPRWVPWADQAWINTTTGSRSSIETTLPNALPEHPSEVVASTASTLSQKCVMPQHARKMQKQKKGPEDLKVHQARMVNAVFYASPNRFTAHHSK